MDLAIVVKTAGTAVRFVEGGPLAEALAELNMSAARSALLKAEGAVDKRSQVWSAVNHLEGAVAAIDAKTKGPRGNVQYTLRGANWARLQIKRAYILALMAICYRYLGEEKLAQQCVALGRAAIDLEFPEGRKDSMLQMSVMALFAWPNVIDAARWSEAQEQYKVDWQQFELPPRGLISPDGGSFK